MLYVIKDAKVFDENIVLEHINIKTQLSLIKCNMECLLLLPENISHWMDKKIKAVVVVGNHYQSNLLIKSLFSKDELILNVGCCLSPNVYNWT